MYKDVRISRAEYLRIVETNEREIVHWENHTLESQKLTYELALCWDAIDRLSRKWADSEPEDRRGLAQSLFDYIVYDLDTRRIVDFRLKPWADKYLTLFAGLYQAEGNENPPCQEVGTAVPPRGLDHTSVPYLGDASQILLALLYSTQPNVPVKPPNNILKAERNAEVCTLYVHGMNVPDLATRFGVSKARIYQILKAAGVTKSR